MWKDPIVEEVRKRRAEYAASLNNDLAAMVRDLRTKQEESGRPVVRRPPRKPAGDSTAA
jgi:hypothetical protein